MALGGKKVYFQNGDGSMGCGHWKSPGNLGGVICKIVFWFVNFIVYKLYLNKKENVGMCTYVCIHLSENKTKFIFYWYQNFCSLFLVYSSYFPKCKLETLNWWEK